MSWFLQAAIMMIVGKSADGAVKANASAKKDEYVKVKVAGCEGFRVPLHYPRFKKEDYERMGEWEIDMLLRQYGLEVQGSLDAKRLFAMETFLWPDQI
ncbi:hypothetical protein KSP39_PZI012056 [Platanthera zijinensis]|uniref:DUF7722 domain-containing protein n=1 Tax=Platanthera zijinensis TaxID=2320716 RepID=A0AAP0G4K4_9ASPA